MEAMVDPQPQALPPENLRNLLLPSSDSVWSRMWRLFLIVSVVMQWEDLEEVRAGWLKIAVHYYNYYYYLLKIYEKRSWSCEQMCVYSLWVEPISLTCLYSKLHMELKYIMRGQGQAEPSKPMEVPREETLCPVPGIKNGAKQSMGDSCLWWSSSGCEQTAQQHDF